MPRPKRTKIAPPISSTLSTRVANPTPDNHQPNINLVSSNNTTANSDDSDGLVTTKKTFGRKNPSAPDEATMSGALPPEDAGGTHLRPPMGRRRALFSKFVINASDNKAIEQLKARRNADLVAERVSQVQVPSSMPAKIFPTEEAHNYTNILVNDDVQSNMDMKSKSPGSTEARYASLGALKGKTRPRKPSLLQLVQAQANQLDRDEDDDLDDFLPDDESTPFLKLKTVSKRQASNSSPLTSKQTSSSRKRKLSSPEVQVPMTQPIHSQAALPASLSPTPEPELGVDLFNLESNNDLPEPLLPLARPARTQSPKVWSDTLAPPQSSSPIAVIHTNSIKRSAKPPIHKKSSAGPAIHSSTQDPRPVKATSCPLIPLSTATLQNLLPRRRARPNAREVDIFDVPHSSDVEIDTSGLGEDEDELNIQTKPRGRPRKSDIGFSSRTTPSTKGKGKAKAPTATSAASAASIKRGKDKRPGKVLTYARTKPARLESDDNDEDPDPHLEVEEESDEHDRVDDNARKGNEKSSDELKRLAAKFREVDEWTLEIEDVTASSGSLMADAR